MSPQELDRSSHRLLPTVADVLALPTVRYGRPEVQAGRQNLDRRVRWAHVSELPDIAGLLQGGELILTTGIALPVEADALRQYVGALVEAGAAGLMVELGRRFTALPSSLTAACERHGLPLVAFHREVKFVKVTEAVHSLIVEEQFTALRTAVTAHEVLTSLCIKGATVAEIVGEVSRLADCPVIFENLLHRVLAHCAAGVPADDLLRDWEARSRVAPASPSSTVFEPEGWVLTPVIALGQTWGRLVLVPDDEPTPVQVMIVEHGAVALTLNRLLEHSRETLERQAQRSTLTDIVEQRYTSAGDMHARTAALGVPTGHRTLVAIVVDLAADDGSASAGSAAAPGSAAVSGSAAPQQADRYAEIVGSAVRASGVGALTGVLSDRRVGVLLPLRSSGERTLTLQRIAANLHDTVAGPAVIGVGSAVSNLDDVGRSFAEAGHVAHAARGSREAKAYFELPDIRFSGLMCVLSDDPRMQAFVELTLAPLLEYDSDHGTALLDALCAYLDSAGNKSHAAARIYLSRQAFYERLAAIEQVLEVDLDSAETRTSLHAAVMALKVRQV